MDVCTRGGWPQSSLSAVSRLHRPAAWLLWCVKTAHFTTGGSLALCLARSHSAGFKRKCLPGNFLNTGNSEIMCIKTSIRRGRKLERGAVRRACCVLGFIPFFLTKKQSRLGVVSFCFLLPPHTLLYCQTLKRSQHFVISSSSHFLLWNSYLMIHRKLACLCR